MQTLPQNCYTRLSHLGLLRISGQEAKTFLQGQVTCHLHEISLQQSQLSAHCNVKGRMQSLFRILMMENAENVLTYYLVFPSNMVEPAMLNFKKFAIFSKVTLTNISKDFCIIGIYGPEASKKIATLFAGEDLAALNINECKTLSINQQGTDHLVTICRISGLYPRYEIYCPTEFEQKLSSILGEHFMASSHHFWDLLDIQAGIPAIYPSTADKILPHHVNLALLNGISFSKGCYVGQEVIAKMQFRGKIKKHMYRAFISETQVAPLAGDPIYADGASDSEAPGIIVRSSEGPGGYELLVVIDDHYFNQEKHSLLTKDKSTLEWLDLPYRV